MPDRPLPEDYRIASLAAEEGWQTLARYADGLVQTRLKRLADEKFEDLSDVARLQGEITGIQKVIETVNNRKKRIQDKSRG
jgi:hypothetical protein